ncbi:winged helix-turn-helix domain-containing protein [Salinibaculum salinum]|uniref:winged helix-turn-helix domain-containing protein n=1 Tax=Salinibaculum salinum TaxID=3131996 RepID=UPI0030EDEA7C
MGTTLTDYLNSKGGIGILAALQKHGKTYSEIEPDVLITSSTISTRTDDGIDAGLLERAASKRKDRTVTEYRLTDYGEAVVRDLSQRGILSSYQEMRDNQRALDEKTENFLEWANENPSHYVSYMEPHEETLPDRNDNSSDSLERVVKPRPDDQIDEPTDSPDSKDSEPEDKSQSRLSDANIQEKMQGAAHDTDNDENAGEDAASTETDADE